MTTALDIIKRAYRDENILAVGDSPSEAELRECIPILQGILDSTYGRVIGSELGEWFITPTIEGNGVRYIPTRDYLHPITNSRLLVEGNIARTVVFPERPSDGDRMSIVSSGGDWETLTINFNNRAYTKQNDRSVSEQTLAITEAPTLAPIEFFYRGDLGKWLQLSAFDENNLGTELMPLPQEFDDYFSASLALRIAPRYSVELSTETATTIRRLNRALKSRYSSFVAPLSTEINLLVGRYDRGGLFR